MAADLSTSACVDSPKSHRNRKNFPSPWKDVVRGEPDAASPPSPSSSPEKDTRPVNTPPPEAALTGPVESQMEGSDSCNENAASSKKSAWKPINDVVGTGPVMGAAWPTISESTRASPKSSSNSSKPVSDGSSSVSQESVKVHAAHKQANANGNPVATPNHTQPFRQRSMRRGGGAGGGSGQSGFSRAPPPPPPPPPPPFPNFTIPFGNILPPMMELPNREPIAYKGSTWEPRPMDGVGSHSQGGNDHSSQRHSSRRGNFGSRNRGDGGHNNGYGGRRDQDRDWNAPRNSSARGTHMQQMAPPPPPPPPPPPRGLTRPALPGSPVPIPFIAPQHVRPFGPMAFDMVPSFFYPYPPPLPPESFRGVPLVALPPPPTMFFPVMDSNIRPLLLSQIDYYFSDANLVKDDFLRSNMDDQGWVPISLIANFPRVLNLSKNVQFILDTLGASTVVEVQGEKVRRRDNWKKWIPSSGQLPPDSGLQSPSESIDKMLATSIEKVHLDEVTSEQIGNIDLKEANSESLPGRVSPEAMITQSKLANGEDTAEAA